MELLKRRIAEDGRVLSDQDLNVDSFLNHGVDPELVAAMGREFAGRFRSVSATRILTIESSGIAIAYATALELGVPLVYARRRKTLPHGGEYFTERVPSFTKGIVSDLYVAKHLLTPEDRILIIDDMIAGGDAVMGAVRIVERSGATLAGIGIAIEKMFQPGSDRIRSLGVQVESLARITSLADGKVEFM